MTTFTRNTIARWAGFVTAGLCALGLNACSALRPAAATPPAFYALDSPPDRATRPALVDLQRTLPTLIITPTRAASGFDSQRIIYVRKDHQLEYFSHSEWVDPPARMLGPLLASAIEQTGAFAAVVLTPASAAGDQRLDTEIVRLQHNFQTHPSRVQFTLRAYLMDDRTRRVLAWQEFSDEVEAPSETPQGGVTAANQVVPRVLAKLAQFAATGAGR
jgi:cholesterol transport system auxiliary component